MGKPRWLQMILRAAALLCLSLMTNQALELASAQAAVVREHSGRLTTESGAAVKGPVNLEVLLYRRKKGGDPLLPAPLIFNNVQLDDGRFSIRVELSSADSVVVYGARGDAKVWVQILDQSHDRLYPRQKMTGVAEMVTGITRAADAKARSDEAGTATNTETDTSTFTESSTASAITTDSKLSIMSSSATATDQLVAVPPQSTSSDTLSTATLTAINASSEIAMPAVHNSTLTSTDTQTDEGVSTTSTDTAGMISTDAASLISTDTAGTTSTDTAGMISTDAAGWTSTDTASWTSTDTASWTSTASMESDNIDASIEQGAGQDGEENSLSFNLPSSTFVESPLNPEPSDARAELGTIGQCGVDSSSGGDVRFRTSFTQRPWVFLQAGDGQTSSCQPRIIQRDSAGFSWSNTGQLFALSSCSCIHWMAVGR